MLNVVENDTKTQKIEKIKDIIVNTMLDNYNMYGASQGMSQKEIDDLINTNMPGVIGMAEAISVQIYDALTE